MAISNLSKFHYKAIEQLVVSHRVILSAKKTKWKFRILIKLSALLSKEEMICQPNNENMHAKGKDSPEAL